MKKDNLLTIVAVIILVTVFSLWNINFIEAKQDQKDGEFDPETVREILWLARVIYSETKEVNEQVLVAWVVRNRVESAYRGNTTYYKTAIDKSQFSGLNPTDAQYLHNISRNYNSIGKSWESALEVAEAVHSSSGYLRPLPKTAKHFYSPRSVRIAPDWSVDHKPVLVIRDNSENRNIRFAFYNGIK
jgi:spore germination cell wall hydrolase CwlJ-like protein